MKNLNRLLALLLVVSLLAGYAVIPASAARAGTGTIEDPITCSDVSDVAGTYHVPAGETVYFSMPVAGMMVTVSDENGAASFIHPWTGMPMGTEYDASEAFPGMNVNFAVCNMSEVDTDITLATIVPTYPEGSMKNPAEPTWFGNGVDSWLMNTTLEAGDEDGYWYVLTAEKSGILTVKNASDHGFGTFKIIQRMLTENVVGGIAITPLRPADVIMYTGCKHFAAVVCFGQKGSVDHEYLCDRQYHPPAPGGPPDDPGRTCGKAGRQQQDHLQVGDRQGSAGHHPAPASGPGVGHQRHRADER